MDLAGHTRGQVRDKIEAGAPDFIDVGVAAERGRRLGIAVDVARAGNGGAGKRLHRTCRQRVHPDVLPAEIDGKIAHRRLERRLGHAHDIVVR